MATRPAPGNRNRISTSYKDSLAQIKASKKQAQYGVAGARGGAYFDRSKYGIEAVYDPITGGTGLYNLVTTDYNPENIKYPTRMVPAGARGGGMVSGGQPNISDTIMGLGAAIKSSVEATPITEFDKARYEKNPFSVRGSNLILTPEQKSERAVQVMIADREKEYSDLLRTLKAAGLTEEELYRSAVVSPDGQVNLNPNAQATIAQLGNAADSLRLLDVTGLGVGKAVGAGVGYGARTATRGIAKGLDNLVPRMASVATNPRIINAGMQSVEAAARGARPGEVVATGLAGLVNGNKPIANATRSRILPSGEKQVVDRVIEAREAENFVKNRPTPEASSPAYFGGVETRNLSPEALDEKVSGAAEYISPEELADELLKLENVGFATVDKTPASAKSAVSLTQKELADRTAAALSGIKKRERAVNAARAARGEEPFEYNTHFDPYDLTKEELVTLWGSNPIYVYNKAGELIPELGAHLGHGPGQSLKSGGSATLGTVRGQRGVSNMRYGSEF